MSNADAEVRQRSSKSQPRNEVQEKKPAGVEIKVRPNEQDLVFYGFCAAVLNAATTLLVAFSYAIYSPGSQDEVDILIRAAVLSIAAAAAAGAISWYVPVIGTAFLGGILFGIIYIFGGIAMVGEDGDPIKHFLHGWVSSSLILYVVFKTGIWTPF